jgi:hypothetical protein
MQEGGDRIVRRLIRGDLVRREESARGEGGGLAEPVCKHGHAPLGR